MKDYYEHLLFSSAFGESMSSRLFQTIREEEGLCYSIYSSRAYFKDASLWLIHATTMPGLSEKLLQAVARELERVRTEPISGKELDEAKLQIKGQIILSRQDVEVRMKRLARQFIAMGDLMSGKEVFRVIDAVDEADIRRLTERLFADDNAALLVYGAEELEDILNNAPVLTRFSTGRRD